MQDTLNHTETYAPKEHGPIIETERVIVITVYDRFFMRSMLFGMFVCFLAMLVACGAEYFIILPELIK